MARLRRRRRNAPLNSRELSALRSVLFKHTNPKRRRKARKSHRRNPRRRVAHRRRGSVGSTRAALLARWRWHHNPSHPRRYLLSRRRHGKGRRNPRVAIRGRRGRQVASFVAGAKNRAKRRRRLGTRVYAKMVARGKRLAAKHGFQKYTAARLTKMRAKAKRGWLAWRRRQMAKR